MHGQSLYVAPTQMPFRQVTGVVRVLVLFGGCSVPAWLVGCWFCLCHSFCLLGDARPCLLSRRKHHRPGIAPNANTTHVPTAGSSAAPTKPNHTPSRHSCAKGKLPLQPVTSPMCATASHVLILKYEKRLYQTRILQTLNPGSLSLPGCYLCPISHSTCTVTVLAAARGYLHVATSGGTTQPDRKGFALQRCYTEKAPNAWQRRGTRKTRNTYNQPNRPNQQTAQTKHQAPLKGQPERRITPNNTVAVHASAQQQPTISTNTRQGHQIFSSNAARCEAQQEYRRAG